VATYAEGQYFKDAMQKREYGPRNTGPKLPKMPALQARRVWVSAHWHSVPAWPAGLLVLVVLVPTLGGDRGWGA
jgi:hypothetical protein